MITAYYYYGMRLRGFSMGCQPTNGLTGHWKDTDDRYYEILEYNRLLTAEELEQYELDYIGMHI